MFLLKTSVILYINYTSTTKNMEKMDNILFFKKDSMLIFKDQNIIKATDTKLGGTREAHASPWPLWFPLKIEVGRTDQSYF